MRIDDKIKDEKVQCNQQEAALSSDKTEKDEYLTGEEILPSDQSRIIVQNRTS